MNDTRLPLPMVSNIQAEHFVFTTKKQDLCIELSVIDTVSGGHGPASPPDHPGIS